MPTGTLKYKQDDGSIIELIPAGFVSQTTYNEGQAAQNGRLDALENAHHYANIKEALENQGYLNVVRTDAPFTFVAASSAGAATVTFKPNARLRIQLPPDTVIDDVETVPADSLAVHPHIGYIDESGKYTIFQDGAIWPITDVSYLSAVNAVDLTLTPTSTFYIRAKSGTLPLFWNFTAYT